MIDETTFAVICGFALDLAFGDPVFRLHPTRLMGRAIEALEPPITGALGRTRPAGALLALAVVGGSFAVSFAVLWALRNLWQPLGMAAEAVLVYTALSARDLADHAWRVKKALEDGDLANARSAVAMLVGRDTEGLDKREVARATVESVAESTVDGILSPLFFAFLGGAPLAMAYKAVNTLDSMVGHKDERYIRVGWASARLDDLANFVPARLSMLVMPLASAPFGGSFLGGLKAALFDAVLPTPFSNSAVPEAATAGALGVELGGVNYYGGEAVVKNRLGKGGAALDGGKIGASIKIALAAGAVGLAVGVVIRSFM